MKRILIIGMSGSGKTTLAIELGERLGLPVVHLDRLYWKPGWREATHAEFDRKVRSLLRRPRWIMDGHYHRTLPLRLRRADTVLWLDHSRWTSMGRIFRRLLSSRRGSRPDLPSGCREHLDWSFLRWAWGFNRRNRREIIALLSGWKNGKVFRWTRPSEARRFLDGLASGKRRS